jgi:ribonuclease BN (tRNA processing enzyme)
MELGNGTLAELQRHCHPFAVSALLLSHLHLDHCGDVSALTEWWRGHPARPADPVHGRLPLYAPSEARTRLAAAHAESEAALATADLSDVFDFHELRAGSFTIGPFEITVGVMEHICEAYGFRVSHKGRSLVYTGDTARCDALSDLTRGADVLLADTAWVTRGVRPDNLHMSAAEGAQLANEAGVSTLLLTHVLPWSDKAAVLDSARSVFHGETQLARQGATFAI